MALLSEIFPKRKESEEWVKKEISLWDSREDLRR